MNKNISCGLIILNNKKILLCHVTKKNFWDIPKGHKKTRESYIDCCLRETKEETGLVFHKENLIDIGECEYTKEKNLYLFAVKCNLSNKKVKSLKCSSYFDYEGTEYPEMDNYKLIDIKDIDKYVNNKLSLVLHKVLKMELTKYQKESIRRLMCYQLRYNLIKNTPWVDINDMVKACKKDNPLLKIFNKDIFVNIAMNDKDRFSIKNGKIKCNYGYSSKIPEEHPIVKPPNILYHNTFSCFLENIKAEGLKPMNRNYVFLATTEDKARSYTGKKDRYFFRQKYGENTNFVLEIDAKKAYEDGIEFYKISDNIIGVKNQIPIKYIKNINNFIVEDNFSLFNEILVNNL